MGGGYSNITELATELLSPPSGLHSFSSPQKQTSSHESRNDDFYATHTWQPPSRPTPDTHREVETSTETHGEFLYTSGALRLCSHGGLMVGCLVDMWGSRPEEQEHSEAVHKVLQRSNITEAQTEGRKLLMCVSPHS